MGVAARLKRKRIYVYLELIHIVVWQKLTQHCKAIIFQLKRYMYETFFGILLVMVP